MSDDPIQYIRTSKNTGEVYAAAYGYLQVMLHQYIHGHDSLQQLADEYATLQRAVSEELEKIMERANRKAAEFARGHVSVTVTADPEVAEAVEEADRDSVILDAR